MLFRSNGIATTRGWCELHYSRWRQHGNPHTCLRTSRGKPMRWLRDHVAYPYDDCLTWPFSKFKDGYGQAYRKSASCIMCCLAHGEPPTPRHEAAHSCGNGRLGCVNPRHLRWATKLENESDKIAHNTLLTGERCAWAKLTDDNIREIRTLSGTIVQQEIAAKFNVHQSTINKILRGRWWRHVQ